MGAKLRYYGHKALVWSGYLVLLLVTAVMSLLAVQALVWAVGSVLCMYLQLGEYPLEFGHRTIRVVALIFWVWAYPVAVSLWVQAIKKSK